MLQDQSFPQKLIFLLRFEHFITTRVMWMVQINLELCVSALNLPLGSLITKPSRGGGRGGET